MEPAGNTILLIGEWRVDPAAGEISRNGETIRLEVRTMRLLMCLADHAGQVVSIEDLLSQVWPEVTVSQDSVYQAVTSLRRQLGDDAKQPAYIATVPRLGYRMVAKVRPLAETNTRKEQVSSGLPEAKHPGRAPVEQTELRLRWLVAPAIVLLGVLAVAFLIRNKDAGKRPVSSALAAQPQKSIAVLPFLDLTEGMKEEEFADGMTEELINRLSKIPDFRVPVATSSFYFKGKQLPVADIAKSLGVVYVLDGSVRKSDTRLRVAARLVRAENGYVIWSETYDRALDDKLWVQEDIAGEVTKALRASIEGKAQ
ncbi:MAG TPA: winged helix-turn-helix domain-containing protein [Candidatus Eisenbacteria bacterium]|nr:winged helix-turn-helix domain-containing protein [Candidatus Eisenbacteria bacterium]